MFEVFTTVPGLILQIGTSGWAFPEGAEKDPEFAGYKRAVVSDEVGEQLQREIRGSYQDTVDDPDNPGQRKQITVKFGRGPNTQLKVRKVADTAAPKAAPKPAVAGEKKE